MILKSCTSATFGNYIVHSLAPLNCLADQRDGILLLDVLRRLILSGLIVASALFVAYLNRYKYFRLERGDGIQSGFRTNRFTNETDMLGNSGWHVVQTPEQWRTSHWGATHTGTSSFDDVAH